MYYDKAAEQLIGSMGRRHGRGPMEGMERFSKGEMFALHMLDTNGGPMYAGEVAEHMHVSSARVATVLGKLEEKGYIERRMDRGDRRRIEVLLTDEGRRLIVEQKAEMKRHLAMVFKRMGRKDTEEFLRLTDAFFAAMQEASGGDGETPGACGACGAGAAKCRGR
jgi:DNA-binding MarR family transcriptional regulator